MRRPVPCGRASRAGEGVDYTTNFLFRIRAEEIPEPGSIALLGAGLLGLVGIRRRQQKNKA